MQVVRFSKLFIEKGAKDKSKSISVVIEDKGLGPRGDPVNPTSSLFTGSIHPKSLFISYGKSQTIRFPDLIIPRRSFTVSNHNSKKLPKSHTQKNSH